eukprot:gene26121-31542_t
MGNWGSRPSVPPGGGPNDTLTPVQREYMMRRVQERKAEGKPVHECNKCHKQSAYCYNSFPKRGGTKYLYACERCGFYWSRLEVSEEDYDFLPQ